jgi:hypothetical protein
MNGKIFGALVTGAVLALSAGAAVAEHHETDKACYRKSCGSSVKGHSGSCAGSKVDGLKDEKACTEAGGVWLTADEAAKLKM